MHRAQVAATGRLFPLDQEWKASAIQASMVVVSARRFSSLGRLQAS
jgi:hypothetical protein